MCIYDPETGQLLSASFMDYAMPRAVGLLAYDTELSEVPSTTHPLGIRPAGEGGTVPALAVVINADLRCAVGLRRAPRRDAGDARTRMASDSPSPSP